MKKPLLEIVIFDLDGTLYDSTNIWIKTEKKIAKQLGVSLPKKEAHWDLFGKSTKERIEALFPKEKQIKAIKLFFIKERKSFLSGFKLFPDSKPLLRYFKREGIKIAVATGLDSKALKIIFDKDNLWQFIDFAITIQEVKKEKPNPEILFRVLKNFRKQPKSALYIGDAPSDIKTAKNAGIKVAIVTRGAIRKPQKALISGADYVFRSFSELLDEMKNGVNSIFLFKPKLNITRESGKIRKLRNNS